MSDGYIIVDVQTTFDVMPFAMSQVERDSNWGISMFLGPEFINVPILVSKKHLVKGNVVRLKLEFEYKSFYEQCSFSAFKPKIISRYSRLQFAMYFVEKEKRDVKREVAGSSVELIELCSNLGKPVQVFLINTCNDLAHVRACINITPIEINYGTGISLDRMYKTQSDKKKWKSNGDVSFREAMRESYNEKQNGFLELKYDVGVRQKFRISSNKSGITGLHTNISYLLNVPRYDMNNLSSHQDFWIGIMEECIKVRTLCKLPIDNAKLWTDMISLIPVRHCDYVDDRYGDWFSECIITMGGDCDDVSKLVKKLYDDLINLPKVTNSQLRIIQAYASLYMLSVNAVTTSDAKASCTASIATETNIGGHVLATAVPLRVLVKNMDNSPTNKTFKTKETIEWLEKRISNLETFIQTSLPQVKKSDLTSLVPLVIEATYMVESSATMFGNKNVIKEQARIVKSLGSRPEQITFIELNDKSNVFYDRFIHCYTSYFIDNYILNAPAIHALVLTNKVKTGGKLQYGVTYNEYITGKITFDPQDIYTEQLWSLAITDACRCYPSTFFNKNWRIIDYYKDSDRILDLSSVLREKAKENMKNLDKKFEQTKLVVEISKPDTEEPNNIHVLFIPVDKIARIPFINKLETFVRQHCTSFTWEEVELAKGLVDYRIIVEYKQ